MSAAVVIAGRYELGDRLGYGGMSTVQVALDRRLERQVAVKLLAEHLADDSQFVSRFRREALSAARLVHPNIVQVFDFGLDEASGRHYIVMEYIQGRSGAEILREETRLDVRDTLELVDGACRGLAHAHRMGVIHRDVKPGNILRSDEGAVKLADFGIAKAMAEPRSQITQVGSVLGTAAYLAPEQASGGDVGPAADLYGLGVVAYQLLAGRLPYDANSLTELALMQQREYPPRLDEVLSEVPPALGIAVARALALDPEERYASADDMRSALQDGARGIAPAGGEPTAATSLIPRSEPTAATRAVPGARRLEAQAPRHPPPVVYDPEPVAPVRSRDEPRRNRGAARFVVWLLILAIGAAAIAYALGNSTGGGNVQLRDVNGNTTGEIVDQMKQLIDDNTK
ncbi:MAG: eukaryotic-like serine/threonine-protein kinase [Solirubrobacteraceae bacterium]|jgi:serine/threonine-protein kinase|nr:eukaryotic-like serine/threonine-protein kinase [Solirubrobacteraceae bacterium]